MATILDPDAEVRRVTSLLQSLLHETGVELKRDTDALRLKIAQARASGTPISESWLLTQREYVGLARSLDVYLDQVATAMSTGTSEAVQSAISTTSGDLRAAVRAAGGSVAEWADLSPADLLSVLDTTFNESAVRTLYKRIGSEASRMLERELTKALVRGLGADDLSRALQRTLGWDAGRSLTVARTELLRSSRLTAAWGFQRNQSIVTGWQWMATPSRKPCSACFAMHGTVHPVQEVMSSHPNCRCSPVPIIRDVEPTVPSGEVLFRALGVADQREILGDYGYRLWRQGKVSFSDFAQRIDDPDWGVLYLPPSGAQLAALARV